jgi:hypothetical protein
MNNGCIRKSVIGEESMFDLWCCDIQLLHGDERRHKACDCVL